MAVIQAEVVDAVVQKDVGVHHRVALAEWTVCPFADQATGCLSFILGVLPCWAGLAASLAVIPAELVPILHLPALPKLYRTGGQGFIRAAEIISRISVVIATKATQVLGKAAGDLHHQVAVPIVGDLQRKVGLDEDGTPTLVELQFSLVQRDGKAGLLVVHLQKKSDASKSIRECHLLRSA